MTDCVEGGTGHRDANITMVWRRGNGTQGIRRGRQEEDGPSAVTVWRQREESKEERLEGVEPGQVGRPGCVCSLVYSFILHVSVAYRLGPSAAGSRTGRVHFGGQQGITK